jgi:RNA polymerase sigma factor (sigma-70 family)
MQMRDVKVEYRRLLATLESRARWLGSKDPESAAQETLRRSLEDSRSQSAIEYYFSDELPPGSMAPEWPLDRLFAWLHGVLHFVVREEHNRVSNRREVLAAGTNGHLDPADPAPDQLDRMIQQELQEIVVGCLPALDSEYREVLKMRASGLKYGEIALQMGVSENTVASWVSRGIRTLALCVRRRTERRGIHRNA